MSDCPRCRAALEGPLACAACGALLEPPTEPTPFAVLGLEPRHDLDPGELKRRFLRIGRATHPDLHAGGGAERRALAERNSARVNRAQRLLADEAARADWLTEHLGGPSEEQERSMPAPFLAEVLEWNETLEEARARPDAAAAQRVDELGSELAERRRAALGRLRGLLVPLPARGAPALGEARRELNAVRYLDRALEQIEALRLARPATR